MPRRFRPLDPRTLSLECSIHAEMNTTNAIGEVERGFDSGVTHPCLIELQGRNSRRNDLDLGQIIENNTALLMLLPGTPITTSHKVVQDGTDYKVNRVRKISDPAGEPYYTLVDLEVIE